MANRIGRHFCLFLFFVLLISPVLLVLVASSDRLENDGEEVAYYEGHIRAYPDDPQRQHWEGQIRQIRLQQAASAALWLGGLFVSYVAIYGALKLGFRLWRANRWGVRFWLPRLIVAWVGWFILAFVVTLALKEALPAATDGRFDPFRVDPPVEQRSEEWDVAVNTIGAIRQDRVRQWTNWFGIVAGVYAVGTVVVISHYHQQRRRKEATEGPAASAKRISWGN